MKKTLFIAVSAFGLAVTGQAASHRDYKVEEREAIHHVFSNDSSLDVDCVNGSITVTGDNGNTIRVEGEKIIRAADMEEAQRAKSEVALDINEKGGVAQIDVNGPFRDKGHSDREYEVTFNFTIHVPRAAGLRLRTINGDVKTEDTAGSFDVHNINGGIAMTNIAGSGTADTLNGPTLIAFRENPGADSYFKSFNGRVDITFQPDLSADLRLRTFNGNAYTDFEVTALANKSNQFHGVRVGAGGPELKFETFNGDIRIRKQAR